MGCGAESRAPAAAATAAGGGTSSEQLVGRWTSAGCEAYPNGSGDSVFLKRGSSPWTLNQPGDVSQTGCPVLGTLSLSACPTELDIVQVDSGKLLSGDRAGVNVCTSRPTKLGALYVTKVQ